MEKSHARDNLIFRICMSILKRRLKSMEKWKIELKRMSDSDLMDVKRKYLP